MLFSVRCEHLNAIEMFTVYCGHWRTAKRKAVMDIKNGEPVTAAWLTYSEAQRYASLGRTTLTALVTSGAVPAAKVGKAVRISKSGLDEYMRRNAYTSNPSDDGADFDRASF